MPTTSYIEAEELKATLELSGTTYLDHDLEMAIPAASRAVDGICNRRFYRDDASSSRFFTSYLRSAIWIGDAVSVTALATDETGDGTFETVWTPNTDFVLEPLNAEADGEPYRKIRVHSEGRYLLPSITRGVRVTGVFGWPTVPAAVKEATTILAVRLIRRAREAPFGVVTLGIETAARISASDPDVRALLDEYVRHEVLIG